MFFITGCMYVCVYVRKYVYVCMCVCVYIYIYIYIHTCVCVCVCVCVYACARMQVCERARAWYTKSYVYNSRSKQPHLRNMRGEKLFTYSTGGSQDFSADECHT